MTPTLPGDEDPTDNLTEEEENIVKSMEYKRQNMSKLQFKNKWTYATWSLAALFVAIYFLPILDSIFTNSISILLVFIWTFTGVVYAYTEYKQTEINLYYDEIRILNGTEPREDISKYKEMLPCDNANDINIENIRR